MSDLHDRYEPSSRLVPRRATPDPAERLSLWDQQEPEPPKRRRDGLTLDEAFTMWCAENPDIVEGFMRYALEARKAGASKIGGKLIAERLRWDSIITKRDEPYRVNNNYVSRLVRLAIERYPDSLGGDFFDLRELTSRHA